MPQTVRGVVALGAKQPVSVENVVVPDPGAGEVVVQVQACGVCHTDLHYREGGISDDFPFLLGHEAAGVVDAVGAEVTSVAVGDFVVLNWRAVCGECRACRRGRPWYCFNRYPATGPHSARQRHRRQKTAAGRVTVGTELRHRKHRLRQAPMRGPRRGVAGPGLADVLKQRRPQALYELRGDDV